MITFAVLLVAAQASPSAAESLPKPFVRDLCAAVSEQTLELRPTHDEIVFRYQQAIARMAGVTPSDSPAVYAAKMGRWVSAHMPQLLCNQFNFNPSGGNILKLAIARSSDTFIDEVTIYWRVHLDQVDAVDGMTVLDYIRLRKGEAGTNRNLVTIYQQYYDRFRAAGAHHASELK